MIETDKAVATVAPPPIQTASRRELPEYNLMPQLRQMCKRILTLFVVLHMLQSNNETIIYSLVLLGSSDLRVIRKICQNARMGVAGISRVWRGCSAIVYRLNKAVS